MLSIRHLDKSYYGPGSRLVLRDIGFELAAGAYCRPTSAPRAKVLRSLEQGRIGSIYGLTTGC